MTLTEQPGSYRLGYARVSTQDQNLDLQIDALERAGCQRIFTDRASGKLESRPALDELLALARPGDTLVVWRLDRLGRSLRHLIDTVASLDQREVQFASLTEAMDTTTPGGKLIFNVMAALCQFETELLRERTMAGLEAARARGRVGGRPSVMTPDKLRTARAMRDSGDYDVTSIAKVLGVSRATIYRALDLPRLEPGDGRIGA